MRKHQSPEQKAERAAKRRERLAEFGLVDEDFLAEALGVTVKTLRNRPASELPEAVEARGFPGRIYRRDAVEQFLTSKPARRRRKATKRAAGAGAIFGGA